MENQNENNRKPLTQHTKILIAVTLIGIILSASAIVYTAYSISIITAPEHVTGTPVDPTPTPSPTAEPAVLHLSSNNTNPFYKGDTLHLTATLTPAQANIPIVLYDNGYTITTNTTDSSGVATFDRNPVNPYDYTASAELP